MRRITLETLVLASLLIQSVASTGLRRSQLACSDEHKRSGCADQIANVHSSHMKFHILLMLKSGVHLYCQIYCTSTRTDLLH